jgi:hypothetical protein
MPLKLWDEAFLTATYLINMLPSKTINNETPVHRLLGTKPDYKSLRVFGCACWPNLRPYNKRKLAFRSTQCVFLGYSPKHKGVKCLEVSSGRVYISRDVVFDEAVFPFQDLHPNAGARLRQEILLLDSSLLNSDSGDATFDDPHVTNLPTTNGLPSAPLVVQASPRTDAENLRSNGTTNHPPASSEILSQNANSSDPEEDFLTQSASDHEPDAAAPGPDPRAWPIGAEILSLGLRAVPLSRLVCRPGRRILCARSLARGRLLHVRGHTGGPWILCG